MAGGSVCPVGSNDDACAPGDKTQLSPGGHWVSPQLPLALLHSPYLQPPPPRTPALLLRPSVTALEMNSSAGVIKDNELLISTGEHN